MKNILIAALLIQVAFAADKYQPPSLIRKGIVPSGSGISALGNGLTGTVTNPELDTGIAATHTSLHKGEATSIGTTAGTADAFTGCPTQSIEAASLVDGKTIITARFHTAANAAATFNVCSHGDIPLRDSDGTAAGAGDFSDQTHTLVYETSPSPGWRKLAGGASSIGMTRTIQLPIGRCNGGGTAVPFWTAPTAAAATYSCTGTETKMTFTNASNSSAIQYMIVPADWDGGSMVLTIWAWQSGDGAAPYDGTFEAAVSSTYNLVSSIWASYNTAGTATTNLGNSTLTKIPITISTVTGLVAGDPFGLQLTRVTGGGTDAAANVIVMQASLTYTAQ